jgi:photosystem II stability/assembly factor-like uncharacterized protein
MNRGRNRGIPAATPIGFAALCVGICLAALVGAASAAGTTPRSMVQPDRSWESYFGVSILPSGRAVVVGDKGVVMVSDDQGRTWARQKLRQGMKYYDLYSAAFTADGSRGWVVGDNAIIFRSDDHGSSWTEQKRPAGVTSALLKVAVADAEKVCACGEHGVIVCTSDGGANWKLQKFHDIGFFDLAFTSADNGWVVGEFATVLHTTDGGASWKVQAGGDQYARADPYFALAFGGGDGGLAVGLAGLALETSDDGKSWKPGELSIEHRSFYTLTPLPARHGEYYAAGEDGVAALIAGGHASQVSSGTSNAITSAAFSPRFAIAVGLSGTILRSDDGGHHWNALTSRDQTLQTRAQ